MALEMRTQCETCGDPVYASGTAFICVFECTFCKTCFETHRAVCPNCSGELVRRPRPKPGS